MEHRIEVFLKKAPLHDSFPRNFGHRKWLIFLADRNCVSRSRERFVISALELNGKKLAFDWFGKKVEMFKYELCRNEIISGGNGNDTRDVLRCIENVSSKWNIRYFSKVRFVNRREIFILKLAANIFLEQTLETVIDIVKVSVGKHHTWNCLIIFLRENLICLNWRYITRKCILMTVSEKIVPEDLHFHVLFISLSNENTSSVTLKKSFTKEMWQTTYSCNFAVLYPPQLSHRCKNLRSEKGKLKSRCSSIRTCSDRKAKDAAVLSWNESQLVRRYSCSWAAKDMYNVRFLDLAGRASFDL